jgi:phosphoadenosine phosphosulfate reductase
MIETLVTTLAPRYAEMTALAIVEDALTRVMPGEMALVSSFGTESAVLLHMVAAVDPATPVIFLDTGKLFGETLRYRDRMVERLRLTNVRVIKPEPLRLSEEDADDLLFQRDSDRCCFLRKVLPLRQALGEVTGWINGRKGHHGGARAAMPAVEADGPRLKVTPLHDWSAEDMETYFVRHDLPRHPLVEDGYSSVGCYPCSAPTNGVGGARGGRWAGGEKTECGIHTMLWAGDGI